MKVGNGMIVGLLGTDFCSYNRGCGALGYAAIEVLKSACAEKKETLDVYAFLFRLPPMPQIDDENVRMHYIKIEPKILHKVNVLQYAPYHHYTSQPCPSTS